MIIILVPSSLRLLLADDHGLFRDSMAVWLKQLDHAICIDFADSFNSVQNKISHNSYHIVLMDLGMPGMQGSISIKSIHQQLNTTPILIVSADENPAAIHHCIEAGAAGYVTKSSSGDIILQAVKHVLSGAQYIPELTTKINSLILSDKQKTILAHLADGLSNKAIAKNMFLSEGTIKQYVTKLLALLDVDNRVQAGIKAKKILGINNT